MNSHIKVEKVPRLLNSKSNVTILLIYHPIRDTIDQHKFSFSTLDL